MRCLLIALSLLLPVQSLAQARDLLELPYLQSVETRHGVLSVGPVQKKGVEGTGFFLNGHAILGPSNIHAHIQAVLPMPQGGPDDWVLVSVASGGNDCPMLFAFITLSPEGARATTPFGTCSEGVFDLRETEDTKVAFDMIGARDGELFVFIYRFDGVEVDETVNPLP